MDVTGRLEILEWERSKISNQDVNLLKKLGLTKKEEDGLIFPVRFIAYFLRIVCAPCARKTPLWMYAGEDTDRISKDLSVKDLKLVRPSMKHFSLHSCTQFIGYRDTVENLKEALAKANKHADDLAIKLEQSEKAREKAQEDAASVGDLQKRLHHAETSLSEKTTLQIAREEAIISPPLESQNRRFVGAGVLFDHYSRAFSKIGSPHIVLMNPNFVSVGEIGDDFALQEAEDDRLLDALSILELHGSCAHQDCQRARTAFTRIFPYFFPKQTQPTTFSALAKHFLPKGDIGLAFRQENLKVGVEGTIALVAESQQTVDWVKAGDTGKINNEKWKSLLKAAKPHSKKILAFLGYKPAAPSSSTKPEVK
ncbi:hypothetical protein QYE76_027349 [Lolium multiflorum]|uniref:Uncharacterized protein n=1 Tax=Lolium multiflorum TaxID=4521 RepID=A0AAD8QIZ3_LOLMU|nr:hypothetical protein QYE76_027349 [Lolium multiflorum]